MATMNFSVPDDIKAEFNRTFSEDNKSAVLAQLMRKAVEDHRRQTQRARAIDRLLKLQARARPLRARVVRAAQVKSRP